MTHTLTQFRLCPKSRAVRLLLSELGEPFELRDERPWEYRREFLALNPAGHLPVLQLSDGPVLIAVTAIVEYFNEVFGDPYAAARPGLITGEDALERAEVRRLIDWFDVKLNSEVTAPLMREKVHKRFSGGSDTGPSPGVLRAVRANLSYTLGYMEYILSERKWLGGSQLSYADLTAAAHVSCIDYMGEVPWDGHPVTRIWYARMKSRPSLRAVLADRVPGVAKPSRAYDDPDF
ncbi:MAG: glutathione S-transferase family protein [Pseudomonadota bacterium]